LAHASNFKTGRNNLAICKLKSIAGYHTQLTHKLHFE